MTRLKAIFCGVLLGCSTVMYATTPTVTVTTTITKPKPRPTATTDSIPPSCPPNQPDCDLN